MAITENRYTGDGSTVLYSFTFPYLGVTDIKVSLDGANTTAYTIANATQIRFNTAPANGAAIRLYRQTNDEALAATFFPGSAIRAQDLNDNFAQNLYVTQESTRDAGDSIDNATEALVKANTALSTANSAASDAATAISTANTSIADAAAAVVIANAADAEAGTAITTANTANIKAQQALDTVGNALQYRSVPNVAAIPVAPNDNDAVEVFDSTGIESFTPLINVPAGFVGDPGLSVRIVYSDAASTWSWIQYFANDPEDRYLGSNDIGVTVQPYDATYLVDADIDVTVQRYDATTLKSAVIGVTVQGYDADTAKTDVAQTFTAQQTFGELKETVFTLGTTGSIALDPANGSIQSCVLTGAPTFTDSLEAGQTIVLMLEGGVSYTVTWPTITWVTSGGNAAPTLTAKDTLVVWKVSTTLYGAYVGSYV